MNIVDFTNNDFQKLAMVNGLWIREGNLLNGTRIESHRHIQPDSREFTAVLEASLTHPVAVVFLPGMHRTKYTNQIQGTHDADTM